MEALRSRRFWIVTLGVLAWSWVGTAKELVLTEYHQGMSPKYFSMLISDASRYFPTQIESFDRYASIREYFVYNATRTKGLTHKALELVHRNYFTEGREKTYTPQQFLALFKKHPRFTFVVSDHEFIFTYTGRTPWTALKSKHMLLAHTAAKIRCAGEIYYHKADTQEFLVVENASGSYRPGPELMAAMLEFLRAQLQVSADDGFAIKMHPLYFANEAEKQKFTVAYAQDMI
jgi:hypothetical protein